MPTDSLDRLLRDLLARTPHRADPWSWDALGPVLLRVLLLLGLGWVAWRLWVLALTRWEQRLPPPDAPDIDTGDQRRRTLLHVLRGAGGVTLAVLTFFMILQQLGIDVAPLLAGAGVVGLAISFGAQTLVKDVISGLFLLTEQALAVGDYVRVADVAGTVERVGLRTTWLRDVDGTLHVVPNGLIGRISNETRGWGRAVVDVPVPGNLDVDRALALLREAAHELAREPQWRNALLEEPQVVGVESLADSGAVVRLSARTVPQRRADVARELRRRARSWLARASAAPTSHA